MRLPLDEAVAAAIPVGRESPPLYGVEPDCLRRPDLLPEPDQSLGDLQQEPTRRETSSLPRSDDLAYWTPPESDERAVDIRTPRVGLCRLNSWTQRETQHPLGSTSPHEKPADHGLEPETFRLPSVRK